jgi:dTMP kinase
LEARGGLQQALTPYGAARAAAESVTGLDDLRAWEWRHAARAAAPVASLWSLAGTTSDRAWSWRRRYAARAPKVILRTIDGMTDDRAWALRDALSLTCKEAIDSILALDHPAAWALRAATADLWPAAVVKSLGSLAFTPRGRSLVERALRCDPDNPFLLKHVSAIALGTLPTEHCAC